MSSALFWWGFFPDTPPALLRDSTFPVAVAAQGLIPLCNHQTGCALVCTSLRAYAAFQLATRIITRRQILARQRVAIIAVLRQRERQHFPFAFLVLAAPQGLEGWSPQRLPLLPICAADSDNDLN